MKSEIEVLECAECAFIREVARQYREKCAVLRSSNNPVIKRVLHDSLRIIRMAVVRKDVRLAYEMLDLVSGLAAG